MNRVRTKNHFLEMKLNQHLKDWKQIVSQRFPPWIESSYRDVKSDGWQWQKTRLRQPDRAERHWLAMAVALLWLKVIT